MADSRLRLACVEALAGAGFKLGKMASDKDAKYSRFYRASRQLEQINDDEEVRGALESLLKNAKKDLDKADRVLRKVCA